MERGMHQTRQGFVPRDEALKRDLFGETNHVHTGLNFDKHSSILVRVKREGALQALTR